VWRREFMGSDAFNREFVLDLFYTTKGNLDKINEAIDSKLMVNRSRKITMFEKFVKARLKLNPGVLKMANFEINSIEILYLCQYPAMEKVEILDLRKNGFGDSGMDAIAHSPVLHNVRELDLRNNGITRVGLQFLSGTETLDRLEKLDLRLNKLGKRWEEKLRDLPNFPHLTEVRVT
jgi:Ran GTPase-activating protein (RanGAP) involved in mRNA processing and transport